jgi:hypothetical protein
VTTLNHVVVASAAVLRGGSRGYEAMSGAAALHTRASIFLLFLGTAVLAPAQPQQYSISTVAGGSPPKTPAIAVEMPIGLTLKGQRAIATDFAGNVYFSAYNCIFKLDRKGRAGLAHGRPGRRPGGIVTRVAGNSRQGYSGDGGPAVEADLSNPTALTLDAAGNLFIADGQRVRKVSLDGIITTVAGNGTMGASGDGGLATDAQLANPASLAVDSAGDLFIADSGALFSSPRVREVFPSGIITTVAEIGGGPAPLSGSSMAVDRTGNLFIIDSGRIRKVSPDGIITTVAGGGGAPFPSCVAGASADGRPATAATLCDPSSLARDGAGNLFIADTGHDCDDSGCYYGNIAVLKLSPDGTLTTLAGNGIEAALFDNFEPLITVDGESNLFIPAASTYCCKIWMVSPDGQTATVEAGNGQCCYYGFNEAVPATSVQIDSNTRLAAGGAGDLFIFQLDPSSFPSAFVRRVSPDGIVTTAAQLPSQPFAVTAGSAGNLFVSYADDPVQGHRVLKLSPDGTMTTVAGNGTAGDSGDGGRATNAQLTATSVAVDSAGNLFIADYAARRVRRVSPDGIITTVAGNGTDGVSDDGGRATSASLAPLRIAVDGAGNLYIVDLSSNRLRKVSPDGTIQSVCVSFSGGGGPGTKTFCIMDGLTVDGAGNVFVVGPWSILRLSPDGISATIAGNGVGGYSGDGGPATDAQLQLMMNGSSPPDLVADGAGNVYFVNVNGVRVLRPLAAR